MGSASLPLLAVVCAVLLADSHGGRQSAKNLTTCALCTGAGFRWNKNRESCGQYANGVTRCEAAPEPQQQPEEEALELESGELVSAEQWQELSAAGGLPGETLVEFMLRLTHSQNASGAAAERAVAPAELEPLLRPAEPLEGALSAHVLAEFIERGYVELDLPPAELPRAAHRRIFDNTRNLWEASGRMMGAGLGNNILPAVPVLHALLETPTVRSGLASVLGPRYALHPHRFLHTSSANDQDFHQDSSWGRRRMRSHLPKVSTQFPCENHA